MTSDTRLDWLLGDSRPVWVIPARIVESESADVRTADDEMDDAPHESLREHEWEHAHEDGIHRKTLVHPAGAGIIEVHSASPDHLERHLDSVSILMRSRPSDAGEAPQPLFLQDLIADAVNVVTGLTIAELLRRRGGEDDPDLGSLLEGAVADVYDAAAAALDRGLSGLEAEGALSADDCSALHPGELVEALLREPAAVATPPEDHQRYLIANHGSVLTKLGPEEDGRDFSFSLKDVGSLAAGPKNAKYYQSRGSFFDVVEKVRVKNAAGKMTMTIQDYRSDAWKTQGRAERLKQATVKQKVERKSPTGRRLWWHMELVGRAADTEYELAVTWLAGMTVTKQAWDAKPPKPKPPSSSA